MMIDVLGVVNPITAIGTATNNVPTTIAFQALDAFLPTHTPAIVGKKIVMIVRGIWRAPAALVEAPITFIAPIGAYTFIALW